MGLLTTFILIIDSMIFSAAAAAFVDSIIQKWYSIPLKETDEGPHFYAVKELYVE